MTTTSNSLKRDGGGIPGLPWPEDTEDAVVKLADSVVHPDVVDLEPFLGFDPTEATG